MTQDPKDKYSEFAPLFEKQSKIVRAFFIDAHGYHWVWNRIKVYCLEAQGELEAIEPETAKDNGYYASSFEEAVHELVDGGYEPREFRTAIIWRD